MGCASSVEKIVRTVTNAPPSKDDLPEVLDQLKGANKPELQRKSTRAVAYLARADDGACQELVREGAVPTLQNWCGSSDAAVCRGALEALGAISLDDGGSKLVCTDAFCRQLQGLVKGKDKTVARSAMATIAQMAAHDDNQVMMAQAGMMGLCIAMAKDKTKTKDNALLRWSLQALSNLTLSAENTAKLIETDIDNVVKVIFDMAANSDDINVEKYALFTIARLCTNNTFSDKAASMNKLPILFKAATDNIASRKMPAALAIANCADNKAIRIKLVKLKALQIFCEMARVSAGEKTRADMLGYQCIASKGLSKLCATYQIRDVAAKVGALEVVVDMMSNSRQDVRRAAALAVAELSLHEENGRRLCMAGVITPLLNMARSGDRGQENDAIKVRARASRDRARARARTTCAAATSLTQCAIPRAHRCRISGPLQPGHLGGKPEATPQGRRPARAQVPRTLHKSGGSQARQEAADAHAHCQAESGGTLGRAHRT